MIGDLERTVQMLSTDILTGEARVRVFDRFEPAYPILARTLIARRPNLLVTIAALGQRLQAIAVPIPIAIAEAA
jgi:hypothetical protein